MKEKKGPHRFSADNQPSPEAKSAGAKRFWEYRKARKQMFEALCDIEMPDGSKQNFWDLVRKKMQALILDKKSKLTQREKSDLMLKLCQEFMPKDDKLDINHSGQVIINLDKDDSKL
ncbi:MAG: hypothetical protein JSU91_01940 [Thermoplasmatales archaeon]|nr:MAG: hypothetical protein JSU91_01940 [Thermoplasmatales archaeon]